MGCTSSNTVDENAPAAPAPEEKGRDSLPATRPSGATVSIGFPIKTKNDKDEKVFINVFHHNDVTFVRCRGPLTTKDKEGENCIRFDVVIDPIVLKTCLTSEDAKAYVAEQIMEYANTSLQAGLSLDEIKFPRMKRGFVGDDLPAPSDFPIVANETRQLLTERPETVHTEGVTVDLNN